MIATCRELDISKENTGFMKLPVVCSLSQAFFCTNLKTNKKERTSGGSKPLYIMKGVWSVHELVDRHGRTIRQAIPLLLF